MFGVIAGGVLVYFGKQQFEQPGPSASDSDRAWSSRIPAARTSATCCERRGLISDARIFWLGVSAYGKDGQLKAGEYAIKAGASMYDIMEVLTSGKSVLYSLTIPEGLTVEQAFERIARHEALTGDMPAVHAGPEGSLATDTTPLHPRRDAPADHRQDGRRPEEAGRRHLAAALARSADLVRQRSS